MASDPMPLDKAVRVDSITGVKASADGQFGLMRYKSGDTETILAFPFDQLIQLMQSLSHAFGQCSRIQKRSHELKHGLKVEWWEIGQAPDGQHLGFSFRMPGGMEMTFLVHRAQAANMRDTLTVSLGLPIATPDGVTRQ